ncbi:MAG TPA: ATP-binding cassette domain-containing protein, partial [Anaerolineales bacterium]|nr:ATP-binding cassette domain-containing protein [Anaerolineales bacterium]
MTDNILVAKKVVKRFGGLVATDHLDFELPRKSIVSIIGPNGAGKTTFFNLLTGFYKIDEGTLEFDGRSIKGRTVDAICRMGASRTYQNIRLFSNMTAIENVMVGQEPHLKTSVIGDILKLPSTVKEELMSEKRASELL